MNIIVLLMLLGVLLVATLPAYGYSREWGYYPSSIVAAILLILILASLHVTH
ncbi:MAG TPA: DUF3309 family protein [Casimicrobiaceae bacterium]|nr:DUF3309 family protein [Casimicrobiaceae bacterium]